MSDLARLMLDHSPQMQVLVNPADLLILMANAPLLLALGNLLAKIQSCKITEKSAAGVGHEINNTVGFVNANLGSLRRYVANFLTLLAVSVDGLKRVFINLLVNAAQAIKGNSTIRPSYLSHLSPPNR